MPSHYLTQCWNIVNWSNVQWNFNQNSDIFFQENAFETVFRIWQPFFLSRPQCVINGCFTGTGAIYDLWLPQCWGSIVNTLRLRRNSPHFADDNFKCIFLNENTLILLTISLKFVPNIPFNNIAALVQIMAWHGLGAKPLFEPMIFSLLTHICVTRLQWFKLSSNYIFNLQWCSFSRM